MVVDGRTLSRILGTDAEELLAELANRCSGVVVCRASPSQKAAIVRMMKCFQAQQMHPVRLHPSLCVFPLSCLPFHASWSVLCAFLFCTLLYSSAV